MITIQITAWLTLGISSPWWLQRRRGFRLLLNCLFFPGFHLLYPGFALFFPGFALLILCRLRALLAFPWQTAGPDCSSSWWEGTSGMCCSCCHCSLLNWRGHTCPCFPYFPLFFFFLPPNTSEIETLPFAYFFKTLNSTLSQNEKDGWKMKGYASIQCWAPQPSPHPHGRLQSCWFLDPWRDPLDTSPGWPTAQNSQAAVSFAPCTCCLGNADFLWGANCLGQVDGY